VNDEEPGATRNYKLGTILVSLVVLGFVGRSVTGSATGAGGCGEASPEAELSPGESSKLVAGVVSSVSAKEADCNSGSFEAGTARNVTFCRGEDWALPDSVTRSEHGRLIVSMTPYVEDASDDTGYAPAYSSTDWHGYQLNAQWAMLEGNLSDTQCGSATEDCGPDEDQETCSCTFHSEPSISDYLDIGTTDITEPTPRIRKDLHKSMYKLDEMACVEKCKASGADDEDCFDEYSADARSAEYWDPDWGRVLNWFMVREASSGAGVCLWEDFTPSTVLEINTTSAGHNGTHSPNWLGEAENPVPTIFEYFDDWCRDPANTSCEIENVIQAARDAGLCDDDDCTNYKDIYSDFTDITADMYAETSTSAWEKSYWMNLFLQQRREYASLVPTYDGNVYSFFDPSYMTYRCRFHQRVLAAFNTYNENHRSHFSIYLNSESGNLPTLPNSILTTDEIDAWATKMIEDAEAISDGLKNGVLEACGIEKFEEADNLDVSNLQAYVKEDPNGIWSVNINAGGRVHREFARLAMEKGMGIASHGEDATITNAFLQHTFPFVQYDQANLTYKTCLNSLKCTAFIPASSDSVRSVPYPPFSVDSWRSVQDDQLPFSHLHVDMTHLHKDNNTVSQYRKFRMSALGGLAVGVNQIRLGNAEVPGQGYYQDYEKEGESNCEQPALQAALDSADPEAALFEFCADLQANGGADNTDDKGTPCNVMWPCVAHFQPYSFMQWVSKNIGTTTGDTETKPPEAYCALFSRGTKYDGDFYDRMEEIWSDPDWHQRVTKYGKSYYTAVYNGSAAVALGRENDSEAVRSPYVHSMGRFCSLDVTAGGGTRARNFKDTYGQGTPDWDGFPSYGAYEALSTYVPALVVAGSPTRPRSGSRQPLKFTINNEFAAMYPSASYTIKVVFAAREDSEDTTGRWGLNYHNGSRWTLADAVSFDSEVLGKDLYTASFLLEDADFSGRGPGGADLAIRHMAGAHADFLLIRIIPNS
jgi:hypothetical protein